MPARVDRLADPAIAADLLLARRGQAFFSRKLNDLSDRELGGSPFTQAAQNALIVARVGLQARVLAGLVEDASGRLPSDEAFHIESPTDWAHEVEFASTLPPTALRTLSDHAAIHLNVEWRDLPKERWTLAVRDFAGTEYPVTETVWRRAREVWLSSMGLGTSGRWADLPLEFMDRFLNDCVKNWFAQGHGLFILEATDKAVTFRPRASFDEGQKMNLLSGTLAALTRWAANQGVEGVVTSDGLEPMAPPKLEDVL